MALIKITEVDNTQPGVNAQTNEVVLVTGFLGTNSDSSASSLTGEEGKMYYITSIAEFNKIVGDTAHKFTSGIKYTATSSEYLIPANGYDPSYIMAKEYIVAGLAVQYYVIPAKTKVDDTDVEIASLAEIHSELNKIFGASTNDDYLSNSYADVGNYSIKYITTGGYPAVYKNGGLTFAESMLNFAAARGDSIALIDHSEEFSNLDPTDDGSIYKTIQKNGEEAGLSAAKGSYGAMFSTWETYTRLASGKEKILDENSKETALVKFSAPASFAYLVSLADSLQTNAPWLAIAGVSRGTVKNLTGTVACYTNGAADAMQARTGISVNGITNIQPYSYTIWGNRTLKYNAENLTATSFLNIRNLVCDIKKLCYSVARSCTFEQNSDVLWVNFKSKLTPTLDRMKRGYGISDYKIVRDLENGKAEEKATLRAKLILYPIYAVEDFYISIFLNDEEITVE